MFLLMWWVSGPGITLCVRLRGMWQWLVGVRCFKFNCCGGDCWRCFFNDICKRRFFLFWGLLVFSNQNWFCWGIWRFWGQFSGGLYAWFSYMKLKKKKRFSSEKLFCCWFWYVKTWVELRVGLRNFGIIPNYGEDFFLVVTIGRLRFVC